MMSPKLLQLKAKQVKYNLANNFSNGNTNKLLSSPVPAVIPAIVPRIVFPTQNWFSKSFVQIKQFFHELKSGEEFAI